MRIATSQMFDRPMSLMSGLNQQADRLQTSIATGKRLTAPSDDSAGWQRLDGLKRADADDNAYSANVKLAQGLLAQADTALGGVEAQLQRAQEIAVAASNGTLSAVNRAAYATELGGIVDELLSLANSKDVRGQGVFGGADGEAFTRASNGSIAYSGSGQPASVPVGEGDSVTPGVTGDRAFGAMFAVLAAIGQALAAGDPPSGDAVDGLKAAGDQVSAARASVGARAIRLDLIADRYDTARIDREDARTELESTDVTAVIAELQKTLTVLQATQASFTKLSGLSLFDYLR